MKYINKLATLIFKNRNVHLQYQTLTSLEIRLAISFA